MEGTTTGKPMVVEHSKTIYNPKKKSKEMIKDILQGEINAFLGRNPGYTYLSVGRENGRFGEWNFTFVFKRMF